MTAELLTWLIPWVSSSEDPLESSWFPHSVEGKRGSPHTLPSCPCLPSHLGSPPPPTPNPQARAGHSQRDDLGGQVPGHCFRVHAEGRVPGAGAAGRAGGRFGGPLGTDLQHQAEAKRGQHQQRESGAPPGPQPRHAARKLCLRPPAAPAPPLSATLRVGTAWPPAAAAAARGPAAGCEGRTPLALGAGCGPLLCSLPRTDSD